MIEFNGISLDLPKVKIIAAPSRKRTYSIVMRKSFYRRHELAVWVAIDLTLAALFAFAMSGNAHILWTLSDPVMRLLP